MCDSNCEDVQWLVNWRESNGGIIRLLSLQNQFLQMASERSWLSFYQQATELLKRSTIFPQWTEEDTLAVSSSFRR